MSYVMNVAAPDPRQEQNWYYIFTCSLIIHIMVAFLLSLWEIPDIALELNKIPDRFARLILDRPVTADKPEVTTKTPVAQSTTVNNDKPTTAADSSASDNSTNTNQTNEPQSYQKIKNRVSQTGILNVIGKLVKNSNAVANLFAAQGLGDDLDDALAQVNAVQTASTANVIRDTHSSGPVETISIDEFGDTIAHQSGPLVREQPHTIPKQPQTKMEPAHVTGKLDARVIADVVRRNLRGLKYCYERELTNNPNLQGKVVVLFTIGFDGLVSNYQVESSTMNSTTVETCILRMIRRWHFPAPAGGSVTVAYPFVFSAAG